MSEQATKNSKLAATMAKAAGFFKDKAPVYWENHIKVAHIIEKHLVQADLLIDKPKLRLVRQSLLLNLIATLYVASTKGIGLIDIAIIILPQILLFPSFVKASAAASGGEETAEKKEAEKKDS